MHPLPSWSTSSTATVPPYLSASCWRRREEQCKILFPIWCVPPFLSLSFSDPQSAPSLCPTHQLSPTSQRHLLAKPWLPIFFFLLSVAGLNLDSTQPSTPCPEAAPLRRHVSPLSLAHAPEAKPPLPLTCACSPSHNHRDLGTPIRSRSSRANQDAPGFRVIDLCSRTLTVSPDATLS
jgi:hypothetical protein